MAQSSCYVVRRTSWSGTSAFSEGMVSNYSRHVNEIYLLCRQLRLPQRWPRTAKAAAVSRIPIPATFTALRDSAKFGSPPARLLLLPFHCHRPPCPALGFMRQARRLGGVLSRRGVRHLWPNNEPTQARTHDPRYRDRNVRRTSPTHQDRSTIQYKPPIHRRHRISLSRKMTDADVQTSRLSILPRYSHRVDFRFLISISDFVSQKLNISIRAFRLLRLRLFAPRVRLHLDSEHTR